MCDDRRMPPELDAAGFRAATGCTAEQLELLERYRGLLADWNTRLNLVGPGTLDVFWNRHALDSWQLLDAAPEARTWADLGAGAGLPGIVLAVGLQARPGARVLLVESLAKRCRFLSEVVTQLALPAVVVNARAESAAETVDVVTARACAPMSRLLGFAETWIAQGALGLFLKGEAVEAELDEARSTWSFEASLTPSVSDPRGRLVRIERLARRGR
jgi:16S rRNA (guanine527-N7)-methyltransferase